MAQYVARRLLALVPTVLGVALLAFLLMHLTPGDPVQALVGEEASDEAIAAMRTKMGLDRPLPIQFGLFLLGLAQGDMGQSLRFADSVSTLIFERLPATMELAGVALVFSVSMAIPLGVVAAVRRYSLWDHFSIFAGLFGAAVPNFWMGILLMYFLGVELDLFPLTGRGGPLWTSGGWHHIMLPALTLATGLMGSTTRLVRDSMLEILSMDYVRTARAKGLSERHVIYRHALKNAFIPIVTNLGLQLGFLLGGSVLVETVFVWPGVGRLAVQAITGKDFPLVQGVTLVVATTFVLVNTLVDLTYGLLDPRIRYA